MPRKYISKSLYDNYLDVVNENEALKKENAFLRHKINVMESDFNKTIAAMNKKMDSLIEDNRRLKDEVSRLKGIINNNSRNSSLPPSTDQKPGKAPNKYNSRAKTTLCIGGQKGRIGTTLAPAEIEQKIKAGIFKHEVHVSSKLNFMDRMVKRYVKRYVVDLRVIPIVHEYRLPVADANTMAPVSYGNTIKALAVNLVTEHSVPINRTASFLNTVASNSIHLSHGAIDSFLTYCSHKSEATIANISEQLLDSPIIYTDATNISLNGTQSYIRNQSTDNNVLYSSQSKKNLIALSATGILKSFTGLLMIDHETSMYNFGTKHAECNAHLIRYLTKTKEEAKNSWATEMIAFLVGINKYRKEQKEAGYKNFSPGELERYNKRYDEIVIKGHQQNKNTERRFAKREERALLKRLENYKDSYTCFMHNFDVSFTNNMSERDLRKCKNKQKISGGFRSETGKERYCNIMSIIETCKRRGINPITGIERIFANEVLFK